MHNLLTRPTVKKGQLPEKNTIYLFTQEASFSHELGRLFISRSNTFKLVRQSVVKLHHGFLKAISQPDLTMFNICINDL